MAALIDFLEVGDVGVGLLTQLRGARKISPGKVVKATGSVMSGRGCPAACAVASPQSTRHRLSGPGHAGPKPVTPECEDKGRSNVKTSFASLSSA